LIENINVLANDSDPDGGVLSVISASAANGSVTINSDGTLNYEPNDDYYGTDTVSYTISDGQGGTDTATFDVIVTPVSDAPDATGGTIAVTEDTTYQFTVVDFGFTDVDGDSLVSVTIDTLPVSGELLLSGVPVSEGQEILAADIPNLEYQPPGNANGTSVTDFEFTVKDSGTIANGGQNVDQSAGTVNISITGTADPLTLSVVADAVSLSPPTESITTVTGVVQATIESNLGLTSGFLDGFDPDSGVLNHQGNVDAEDGQYTTYNFALESGSQVSYDWTFSSNENLNDEIESGYNDFVIVVIDAPDGTQTSQIITAAEFWGVNAQGAGTFDFTADQNGIYSFHWIVMNGGDTEKDSDFDITEVTVVDSAGNDVFSADVPLYITAQLSDTDGSETISVRVSNVPTGASLSAGVDQGSGVWLLSEADLDGLKYVPAQGSTGNIQLTVEAISTESDGDTYTTPAQTIDIVIDQTINNVLLSDGESATNANDFIQGTNNSDVVDGGAGNDLITGSQSGDTLSGGDGHDKLHGGEGIDILSGNDGMDVIYGDAGNDIIDGGAESDTLYGGSDMDIIVGADGNDAIFGGSENDTITGGSGDDYLSGGSGADTFVWNSGDDAGGNASDLVIDFSQAEGDVLDLSDLLIDEENADNLSQYLHFESDNHGNTIVEVSPNKGSVSQKITLQGVDLTVYGDDSEIISQLIQDGNLDIDQ